MARRTHLPARPLAGLRGQTPADLCRVPTAAKARQLRARRGAGETAGGRRLRQELTTRALSLRSGEASAACNGKVLAGAPACSWTKVQLLPIFSTSHNAA